jgi:hypothetical protein
MKGLSVFALVVFGVAHASQAEIVTVPFEGIVTRAVDTPFDLPLEVNVTPVTGSFKYDTATQPIAVGSGSASFAVNMSDGLAIDVAGSSIRSSSYHVFQAYDNGRDRPFDVIIVDPAGNDFRVNGVNLPTGDLVVYLADKENTLFVGSDSIRMLPTQSQVDQLDFIQWAVVNERFFSWFEFGRIPEPDAVLLASQLLCIFLFRQRSGRKCKSMR